MSAPWRSELHVEELPAPQRIAPYSAAITADVVANGEEVGSGRFVLLHDPAGNAAWQGTFRCRSEEHTSELQSQLTISYAVFCLDRKSVV